MCFFCERSIWWINRRSMGLNSWPTNWYSICSHINQLTSTNHKLMTQFFSHHSWDTPTKTVFPRAENIGDLWLPFLVAGNRWPNLGEFHEGEGFLLWLLSPEIWQIAKWTSFFWTRYVHHFGCEMCKHFIHNETGTKSPHTTAQKFREWWHQTTAATEWIMPLFKQTSGHGPWLAKNQTSPQQISYYFMFDRLISPFFHDFSSILLFWGVYPSFLSHNHLNFRSVVISGLPHGFPHVGSWTFEVFGGFKHPEKGSIHDMANCWSDHLNTVF